MDFCFAKILRVACPSEYFEYSMSDSERGNILETKNTFRLGEHFEQAPTPFSTYEIVFAKIKGSSSLEILSIPTGTPRMLYTAVVIRLP